MMITAPAPAVTRPVDGSLVHRARRLYIDSGQEAVVYLHRDSQLCRSEGFESETRVWVRIGSRAILATLNVITEESQFRARQKAFDKTLWTLEAAIEQAQEEAGI